MVIGNDHKIMDNLQPILFSVLNVVKRVYQEKIRDELPFSGASVNIQL